MKYLLDTHTLIWFFNGDLELSENARQIILDTNNQKYASIVSVWELSIKVSLNKLKFDGKAKGFLDLIYKNGFKLLNINQNYIFKLEQLENFHKDPFDRILIATAISENMKLITRDENIHLYPIEYVW
ncbi:MAG: type II toxin-antitoxin system VapC family toxin [Fibromonadaceae bacterium]|jgi:PIN domain nuclease of toxin-antitoxin system|nr:type II toxin-antitoxin system VapC family toxin [Fibromonadaceae bacterium]